MIFSIGQAVIGKQGEFSMARTRQLQKKAISIIPSIKLYQKIEQRAKNLETSRVGLVMMDMKINVESKGLGHNQRLLSIFIGFSNIYRDRV